MCFCWLASASCSDAGARSGGDSAGGALGGDGGSAVQGGSAGVGTSGASAGSRADGGSLGVAETSTGGVSSAGSSGSAGNSPADGSGGSDQAGGSGGSAGNAGGGGGAKSAGECLTNVSQLPTLKGLTDTDYYQQTSAAKGTIADVDFAWDASKNPSSGPPQPSQQAVSPEVPAGFERMQVYTPHGYDPNGAGGTLLRQC